MYYYVFCLLFTDNILRIGDCAGTHGVEFLKLTRIEIKILMCETDKLNF